MLTQTVPIIRVDVQRRLRPLQRSRVKSLAESMTEIGLLNPISVRAAGDEYVLVAGRHRLEAARALGWKEIAATIVVLDDLDVRLAEIDENLIRNELTDLERGEHLAERKRLYLQKHPETKRGGDQKSEDARSKRNHFASIPSFAADTATKTGKTERAIQQDVQIAERLAEDVKAAIGDTPVASAKTVLLGLSRLGHSAQREVVACADLSDRKAVSAAIAERSTSSTTRTRKALRVTIVATVDGFARAAIEHLCPDELRTLARRLEELAP